jgi:hypothetical protein
MFETIYKYVNYIYFYFQSSKAIKEEIEEVENIELSDKDKNLIDSQVENYQSVLSDIKNVMSYKDVLLKESDINKILMND